MRWIVTPLAALLVVLLLFLLMHGLIRAPDPPDEAPPAVEGVEVVKAPEPEEQQPEEVLRESAPPPPPAAPPALPRPDLPNVAVSIPVAPLDAGDLRLPVSLGSGGVNLGGAGAFGGFAGRGTGSGGGGGYGTGQGFKGKPLIPLSTARPQMPEWACKQGVRGWVEVVFTVMPNGRVSDVKLIDADPRGVFEAAAIESVSHWIYDAHPKAREVKQKVAMNPEDCAYNWQ
jgi:protein TonB